MNGTIDLSPFINGKYTDPASDRLITQIDPLTGKGSGEFAAAGVEAVERAVTSSRQAFEGAWSTLPRLRAPGC